MAFSFYRIKVLLWADILALYTVWMLMPYLTDVWKQSLTRSAAVINLFWGLFYLTLLGFLYLVDTLTGNFWMLLISALSSSCGLGVLAMSTPPALYRITNTCKEYRPECIGEEQRVLLYVALVLIAVGFSGKMVSFLPFAAEQVELISEPQAKISTTNSFVFLVAIVLLYVKPWSIRFGVQAICTVAATIVLMSGVCLYRRVQPGGSPLITVFRVVVAAASKMLQRLPEDDSQLYHGEPRNYQLPHSRRLRCLDKAAIVEATTPLQEQMNQKWRLCSLTEVEETKTTLRMLPICISLIILGLVSSLNSTFFVSQATHMNNKVGKLKIPTATLLWFHHWAKYQFFRNYMQFAKWIGNIKRRSNVRHAPQIGLALSILFAVLCCIAAASVETRRLRVVTRQIDKSDDETVVSMSMFWLLPQFLLMGFMEGTFWSSISFLCDSKCKPATMSRYVVLFAGGIIGSGFLGSILSVHVVGNLSGSNGKVSWFQETLNKSRLDKYYWTLAALCSVCLVLYVLVALWYSREAEPLNPAPAEGDGYEDGVEPVDIDVRCFCCYFTYSRY